MGVRAGAPIKRGCRFGLVPRGQEARLYQVSPYMAWTVTSVLPLTVWLFLRSSSSMFTPAHPVHPSWSSSSTTRLRPVLIYSGANSSQTQPQSFLPLECRRFSGVSCFIVGHFRNTCCPSFVCGFRVMTSRMVFPRIHWFCTDAVVLTTCGEWGHSVLCSTLLHSALKKRHRLHFWYREPLLANLVRSCRQLTVCGSSSFCSIVVAGFGSNRQLDFSRPARPRSAPCPDHCCGRYGKPSLRFSVFFSRRRFS